MKGFFSSGFFILFHSFSRPGWLGRRVNLSPASGLCNSYRKLKKVTRENRAETCGEKEWEKKNNKNWDEPQQQALGLPPCVWHLLGTLAEQQMVNSEWLSRRSLMHGPLLPPAGLAGEG